MILDVLRDPAVTNVLLVIVVVLLIFVNGSLDTINQNVLEILRKG